jgi:hypothetical protein
MYPSNWGTMTPAERRAWRIDKWRNPDIPWVSPEAEAGYKARVDRLLAAINLQKPDRVPVHLQTGFWPADHSGMTVYEAMTDVNRAAKAWKDFNLEFLPDAIASPASYSVPAEMYELLDYKLYSWPGHGVQKGASYQYNENEWMLPEEYDHLISDPTDYMLRVYLPRTVGAFSGFKHISPFFDFVELPFVPANLAGWATGEMAAGFDAIAEAAQVAQAWSGTILGGIGELMTLGLPVYWCGATKAPLDILGDSLRGLRGLIFDMYRRPDKVLAACERLVTVATNWILRRPGGLATPIIIMPLHKGGDGFMSPEQFETFYWPTLRAVIMALISEGVIPVLFAEGKYDSRLEIVSDLPSGSTIWLFDQTNMEHAKETVGRVACIQGNVPLSLLHAGTAEAVVSRTRQLIEVAGEGGGFILDMGAIADKGNPDNLRAMIDTARTYGVY